MSQRTIVQSQQTGGTSDDEILLTSPARPVTIFDESLARIVEDLLDTMHAQPLCVGLAAPQIGVDLSVAVVARAGSLSADLVLINPVVLSTSGKKDVKRESCMSLWGLAGPVERRSKSSIEYYNLEGILQAASFEGFLARVVSHEIDHLSGTLFRSHSPGDLTKTDIFDDYSPIAP